MVLLHLFQLSNADIPISSFERVIELEIVMIDSCVTKCSIL